MASRPMPWWKFSTGTRHHAKVTRFVAMMGNRLADVYLYRLWDYCAEQRADGRFSGRAAPTEIAFAVGFDGSPDVLVAAMVDAGLLEASGDVYTVHDWDEMQSALVRKFGTDASRPAGRSRASDAVQIESTSDPDRVPRGTSAGLSLDLSISSSPVSSPEEGAGETTSPASGQAVLVSVPTPTGPQPEDLQALWNRLAPPKGLQRWSAMSTKRRNDARIALREAPDLAKWEAWLTYELQRPFNLGDGSGRDWKANVDWLLRAKTRDLVNDFDPTVAARTSSGGDRPRLPPRESPPESTQPAAPARRVIL